MYRSIIIILIILILNASARIGRCWSESVFPVILSFWKRPSSSSNGWRRRLQHGSHATCYLHSHAECEIVCGLRGSVDPSHCRLSLCRHRDAQAIYSV
ncbi:hypothetical protein M432DRAFT_610013 [Thermoascus aurantiacus ATCC 26904]